MDRSRSQHPSLFGAREGTLKSFARAGIIATTVAACATISPDFDRIIALQVDPEALTMTIGDTLLLEVQAISAAGDTVVDADIFWAIIDVDSGQLGFTLDATTGTVVAIETGSGRVQARVGDIRSDPITITVVEPITRSPHQPRGGPESRGVVLSHNVLSTRHRPRSSA
ncbi:MAG: hypothetical protein O7F70_06145 [Gemmatimonadetes bacterium]|nr:hypothetical protein [Gemmatimonadota bacterium]